MKCRLRSYAQTPPGGYPYVQTEGIQRKFPSQPLIEAQGQMLSSFRKANHLPRSSILECIEDIDHFTCQRLGCMSSFCVPINPLSPNEPKTAVSPTSPLVSPCGGCGAKMH